MLRRHKGLTLKVIQTGSTWEWKVVTDHNGETVNSGSASEKAIALADGNTAFLALRDS